MVPWLLVLGIGLGMTTSEAGVSRTQSIPIRAGWNAVYLEVQPEKSKPDEVFGELPVETVACFLPGRIESQYLRNPGDAPWREEGWAVWHRATKPEAFLTDLREIQARRALLVYATSGFTWTVVGEARPTVIQWHPDACTFTGLPVDPSSPPTFAQFFAGSAPHSRLRIFRLESGSWKRVLEPGTARVVSGEAYWIETDGASDYQGPLSVRVSATGELDFDRLGAARDVSLINRSAASARVRVDWVDGRAALPLRVSRRHLESLTLSQNPLPQTVVLPPLAAETRTTLRLEPDRDAMKGERGDGLLHITDGRGTRHWIPVSARRAEIENAAVRR